MCVGLVCLFIVVSCWLLLQIVVSCWLRVVSCVMVVPCWYVCVWLATVGMCGSGVLKIVSVGMCVRSLVCMWWLLLVRVGECWSVFRVCYCWFVFVSVGCGRISCVTVSYCWVLPVAIAGYRSGGVCYEWPMVQCVCSYMLVFG